MNNKTKRAFLVLLSFILIFLYSCTRQKEIDENKLASNNTFNKNDNIRLLVHSSKFGKRAFMKIADLFVFDYPENRLELTFVSESTNSDLSSKYDFVFFDDAETTQQWIDSDVLQDLTAWYNGVQDDFVDVIKPNESRKIYSLPLLLDMDGIWYNDSFFKNNGIKAPENYAEFQKIADFATSQNLIPVAVDSNSIMSLYRGSVIPAACDGDGEKVRIDEMLLRIKEMKDNNNLIMKLQSPNAGRDEWLNGKALFYPSGIWLQESIRGIFPNGFEPAFLPGFLYNDDQNVSLMMRSASVGMVKKQVDNTNMLEFFKFLYSPKILTVLVENTGVLTASKLNLADANISLFTRNLQKLLSQKAFDLIHDPSSPEDIYIENIKTVLYGE